MSRILEAEAIVKAKDATGGVFEGIASKIQRINRAAQALSRDVEKQIAAANRLEQSASRSTRAMQFAQRSAHYMGNSATAAVTGAAAIGAAHATRALATRSIKDVADRGHEEARMRAAGMSAKELKESEEIAGKLSAKYKPLTTTSIMHSARNIRSVVGSFEEATHILDPLMKLRVIAEGAHPERAAELEKDFDQLIKGMEIKGVTQDMGQFTHYMDGMAKALNVFGDTLRPTDYYEMFKYGRASTTALSDNFMLQTAPTLAQELGGSSAGKALSSFYTQFVGGKMSNKAVAQLQEYGLLDQSKVIKTSTGNVKGVLPGGVAGSEYLQPGKTDPYQWVNKILLPALAAKGVTDPAQIQEVIAAMASQGTTAQMMSIFSTQQKRIEKDWDLVRGAQGLDAADTFMKTDPKTGAKSVVSQFDNLLTTAAKPTLGKAVAGMGAVSDWLSNLNAMADEHPTAATWGLGGAIGGTALAAGLLGKAALSAGGKAFRGEPVTGGGGILRSIPWLAAAIDIATRGDIMNDMDTPSSRARFGLSMHGQFGDLARLDQRDKRLDDLGIRDDLYYQRKSALAAKRSEIEGQLSDLGYGPAGMPGRGTPVNRMDEWVRGSLLDQIKPGAGNSEPVKAEVVGNATLTTEITVSPSADFMTKIDQRVDNKINAFKANGLTSMGTAGSTGRSSPDASPSP